MHGGQEQMQSLWLERKTQAVPTLAASIRAQRFSLLNLYRIKGPDHTCRSAAFMPALSWLPSDLNDLKGHVFLDPSWISSRLRTYGHCELKTKQGQRALPSPSPLFLSSKRGFHPSPLGKAC